MTLLAYADDAALAADVAKAEAAGLAGRVFTDADGKPITAKHPLIARSPAAAQLKYLPAVTKGAGKAGGILRTDALADAAIGASAVSARAITEPAKPTRQMDVAAYQAALTALIPAVEPVISAKAAVIAKGVEV